ncbi:hypothetical protein Leryth_021632 [Lithospermum erythrorhizon]|nr:hypothetical protein Leryth_021632 [Lithospermum erythrorhizon]
METFSRRFLRTECNSETEIFPFLSLSYKSKASFISLSLPPAWKASNSFKSIEPSPFTSSSAIMRRTSSDEVWVPIEFRIASSSFIEILPSPFASNFLKTCSIEDSEILDIVLGQRKGRVQERRELISLLLRNAATKYAST